MAPEHATTGTQDRYRALCPPAPKHTTDGPQQREYSWFWWAGRGLANPCAEEVQAHDRHGDSQHKGRAEL